MSHLAELISDLVDDRLPTLDRGRAEAHLLGCPACRELVTAEREVKQRLGTLAQPLLPSRLMSRLSEIATAPLPPPGPFAVSSDRPSSSRPVGDRPPSAPWSTGPGRRSRRWSRYGSTAAVSLLGAAGAVAAAVFAGSVLPGASGATAPVTSLVEHLTPSWHWLGLGNPGPVSDFKR